MSAREEWLSRNQIQAYFSRLSILKRKQGSAPTSQEVVYDDIGDVIEEDDWFQKVDDCQSSVQYTTMFIIYVICIGNRNSVHFEFK